MALPKDSVYGYADEDVVEKAIETRLSRVNADKKDQLAACLSDAVGALLEINRNIPVHNKNRYLIADTLEQFADAS